MSAIGDTRRGGRTGMAMTSIAILNYPLLEGRIDRREISSRNFTKVVCRFRPSFF